VRDLALVIVGTSIVHHNDQTAISTLLAAAATHCVVVFQEGPLARHDRMRKFVELIQALEPSVSAGRWLLARYNSRKTPREMDFTLILDGKVNDRRGPLPLR